MSGVKPRLKLLALPISYAWSPNEQLGNLFIRGPININKWSFLVTLNGDFGVKAPPQTCQQSIFGILMASQINMLGQTFLALLTRITALAPGLLYETNCVRPHTNFTDAILNFGLR